MNRELIKNKYGGLCAYTGTPLQDDWQVDHIIPKIDFKDNRGWAQGSPNDYKNLIPCQKIVNHYKGNLPLDVFRKWYLGGLHERLKKLPKNPKVERSIKRKEYLLKVAELFGITPDKPFNGKFYFEKLCDHYFPTFIYNNEQCWGACEFCGVQKIATILKAE